MESFAPEWAILAASFRALEGRAVFPCEESSTLDGLNACIVPFSQAVLTEISAPMLAAQQSRPFGRNLARFVDLLLTWVADVQKPAVKRGVCH